VSLRLFVALDLPAAVRSQLAAWCERVAPDRVRRVPADNLHLTLAFLGSRSQDEADAVAALLLGVAGPLGALATAGALWLPPRRPGVLTVAIAADEQLSIRQAALVAGLREAIAFEPETRAFRPHVTVGRVARDARLRPSPLDVPPALTFAAPGVTLYRSRTQPGGARYEALARVSLPPGPA